MPCGIDHRALLSSSSLQSSSLFQYYILSLPRCAAGYVDDGTGACVVPGDECGCYHPETGQSFYDGQVARPDHRDPCMEWYVVILNNTWWLIVQYLKTILSILACNTLVVRIQAISSAAAMLCSGLVLWTSSLSCYGLVHCRIDKVCVIYFLQFRLKIC